MSNSSRPSHIKNPATNRYIKIGGRVYREMVRNNLLGLDSSEGKNKVVFEGESREEIAAIGDTVKKYEEKINPSSNNKYYAKRNNKVFERKRSIGRVELTNDIQKRCLKLYLENKDLFNTEMSKDRIEGILNDLLHRDLAGLDTTIKKTKKYVVGAIPTPIEEYDSDSDSDYEEDY